MKYRKQQGMSFIGFLLIVVMILAFLFLGMKVTPIYLEYYSVVNAMNGIAEEPGSASYSPYDIKTKMLNRLYLSYSDNNVGEDNIKIVRRNGVQLRVVYQARTTIIGNLDVVASFDRQVLLSN